jgi:hypothetical protein
MDAEYGILLLVLTGTTRSMMYEGDVTAHRDTYQAGQNLYVGGLIFAIIHNSNE